jgi:hypothetical protein
MRCIGYRRIIGVDRTLAATAKCDCPATFMGKLLEESDTAVRGDSVLKGKSIVELGFVWRVKVAEVTPHIARARYADAHMNGPDLLTCDKRTHEIGVG